MIRYVLKRIVLMIPTILLTSFIIFFAMNMAGGDPVKQILPENATVEQQEALREEMGLNDPLLVQYFRYMGGLVTGDMGESYITGKDVFGTFMERLPMTLALGGSALILACVVAIPLGIWTAPESEHLEGHRRYGPGPVRRVYAKLLAGPDADVAVCCKPEVAAFTGRGGARVSDPASADGGPGAGGPHHPGPPVPPCWMWCARTTSPPPRPRALPGSGSSTTTP